MNSLEILLCDDSMLVRKQLLDILTNAGVNTVLEAANGKEALLLIKEHRPDIVFLDIVMPVMNGIEALKEIRRLYPEIKVIMLTSSGTKTNLITALEEGAHDFIQKPWKEMQIISTLERLTDKGGY